MPLKNNLHCYEKLFQISYFPEIAKIFGFITYGYVFCLSAVPIIPVYLDVTEYQQLDHRLLPTQQATKHLQLFPHQQ